MDINHLIDHLNDEAGHKEEVALIIYYLENQAEDETEEVTQANVKEIIRNSRSRVSTNSVSTYFSRLDSAGWISEANGDCYILTHDGEDHVEDLLADGALEISRDEDERFIDTEAVDDERYEKLIEDINDCYRYRIYDGMMVLTRKLFEDMVFQILKTHYAGKQNDMFYDQENGQHYSFDDLLTNLKDGVPTLRMYSRELEQGVAEEIRELKDKGNSGAHSIRIEFSDEEVEGWADDATRFTNVLYEVLSGARIADEQAD